MQHKRILFFAETVTLAHVARPIALANSLEGLGHKLVFACNDRYRRFMVDHPRKTLPLRSISCKRFLRSLAWGTPVYDLLTLRHYIAKDIDLIERVKPDLIVWDVRLPLFVSTRFLGIPYSTTNAYWSPFIRNMPLPLPVLPLSRCMPLVLAQPIFDAVKIRAFSVDCRSLNRLRQENGDPPFGNDLRLAYTDADYTLYGDSPAILPVERLPPHHHFLGLIPCSPPVSAPNWWHDLPTDKPIIYVTLGSSGSPKVMRMVIDAVAELRAHGLFGSASEKTGP